MSFAEIQAMQRVQETASTRDRRSLRQIQEEERARTEEEQFLRWWAEEEERVRIEQLVTVSPASARDRGAEGRQNEMDGKGGRRRPPAVGQNKPRPKAKMQAGMQANVSVATERGDGTNAVVAGPSDGPTRDTHRRPKPNASKP